MVADVYGRFRCTCSRQEAVLNLNASLCCVNACVGSYERQIAVRELLCWLIVSRWEVDMQELSMF